VARDALRWGTGASRGRGTVCALAETRRDVARLFGTDGVRGVANADLTPDLVLALGRAAGSILPPGGAVVVGRDTRLSGPMLEAALVAGLSSAGASALVAGIVPSPAVSWLTTETGAAAGAVVSASHNPVEHNGIKFFSDEGLKLPGEDEDRIERIMAAPPGRRPTGAEVGRVEILEDAEKRYGDALLEGWSGELDGLRIVLDCAFGAAYRVAPRVFSEAGAEVVAINAEPDGARINVNCGSTSLEGVKRCVAERAADLGLAFDGDADRVLAVDEQGATVDGDGILAMTALALSEAGQLHNGVIVTSVMSNLGFRRALEARGIEIVTAPVGDKFVAEAMADSGAVLGGEQSGHIIFGAHAGTGDGIFTGLEVARAVARAEAPLSRLAHFYEPYPQVLINVPVAAPEKLVGAERLWEEIEEVEASLGDEGRILVRASGTERVVRVMVEASSGETAERMARTVADKVSTHLGG
jgi:phosphoglucosamine mutase